MNQENPIPTEVKLTAKVYSAPRRFDLATLFVVMICYSCLLGLFVGIGLPDGVTLAILAFITVVAISQATLFDGKMPRLASLILGGISFPIIVVALTMTYAGEVSPPNLIGGALCCSPLGVSFGYIVGALVGGVFLVADLLRKGQGVK